MLRTTASCILKNTSLLNAAAASSSVSALKFSSITSSQFNLPCRHLSMTPLCLEENKTTPPPPTPKEPAPACSIPPKAPEAKPEEPKEEPKKEEPPKQEPPKPKEKCCDENGKCKKGFCTCKTFLLLALAGIGGTAYYYYDKKNKKPTFGDDTTVVYVLGGPGAGKGTQCANLVKDFGFVHLSAGDLLREERMRKGSKYGDLINNYIKEGKIVPAKITIALLENAMAKSESKRFLVDGFPRKMDQAIKFEEQVCKGKFVLYFECPESVMLERLLNRGKTSGRVDDNIESIKKRFETFKQTSYPVVEYFAKQNKVKTVSCKNSPSKVYAETKAIFTELFAAEEAKKTTAAAKKN